MARSESLETLAIALSAGAVALLVIAAILGIRGWRQAASARYLVLVVASVAAMELSTGPLSGLLPFWAKGALQAVGVINVTALWWFCLSLLVEGFCLRRFEWAGAAVFTLGPAIVALRLSGDGVPVQVLTIAASVAPFLMIVHLIWTAASGLSDDLVAGRRLARVAAPMLLVAAAAVSVLSEQLADPVAGSIVRNGLATGPVAVCLLLWLTSLNLEKLRFEPRRDEPRALSAVDPRDGLLHAALVEAMERDRLFQDHDLTLDRLAAHLRTPAHRLRSLINDGLGFRNFSTYLNTHRIAHARAALADPARGRDSILVIAYESGFGVLQTFNRVFKEVAGVTPKAYRADSLRALAAPTGEVAEGPPQTA